MKVNFLTCFIVPLLMIVGQNESSALLVPCVVQAFGAGLEGKGITVKVHGNGFGCPDVSGIDWPDVQKSAKFVGEEAEAALNLHVGVFGLCMTLIEVSVTLPYKCTPIARSSFGATFGFEGNFAQGKCLAFQQKCGSETTVSAVPYVDMWCRRPPSQGGTPIQMVVNWFSEPGDGC